MIENNLATNVSANAYAQLIGHREWNIYLYAYTAAQSMPIATAVDRARGASTQRERAYMKLKMVLCLDLTQYQTVPSQGVSPL